MQKYLKIHCSSEKKIKILFVMSFYRGKKMNNALVYVKKKFCKNHTKPLLAVTVRGWDYKEVSSSKYFGGSPCSPPHIW